MTNRSNGQDLRRISQMRNLGPACEESLGQAGITTAQQLIDLGPELAFLKMLEAKRQAGMSAKYCNAAYLYAMYGAIHDVDWRDVPAKQKLQFRQLTEEIRASGRYS